MTSYTHRGFHHSNGAALVLGLILLAALVLVGLVGVNSMLFQQRMASNYQQRLLARQAAAVAERWAKSWLAGADEDGRSMIEAAAETPPLVEELDAQWWRDNSIPLGTDPQSGIELDQPLADTGLAASWLIESVHTQQSATEPDTDIGWYRILSWGAVAGDSTAPQTQAVLESIVVRPWPEAYEPGPFPAPKHESAPFRSFCAQFSDQSTGDLPCSQLAWRQRK